MIANQLSMKMRLLHHVIARIVVLKTRHFNIITEREFMLMVSLIGRLAINLPGIMFR